MTKLICLIFRDVIGLEQDLVCDSCVTAQKCEVSPYNYNFIQYCLWLSRGE